ncbi:hypothetical protein JTB14_008407 [Gonioctena quinquepunctata]|nr:hypothetical protein JTB14_008407 [Gonioctena quinquepunctata]
MSRNKITYLETLKKRPQVTQTGFGRHALNEILINPNGHIPQPSNGVMMNNYERNTSISVRGAYEPSSSKYRTLQSNSSTEEQIIKTFYDSFFGLPENVKPKIIDIIMGYNRLNNRQDLDDPNSGYAEEY